MSKAGHESELPGLDRRLTAPSTERWSRRVARRKLAPAMMVAGIAGVLAAAPAAAQVVDSSSTSSTTAPDTSTTDTTAVPVTTTAVPVTTTPTTVDPFDTTTTVTSVEGDSTTTTAPVTNFKKAGHVKDVRGDGINRPTATGSRQLVDGQGLTFFVNTNITFSTTSSASAAMSEASFSAPVNATTIGGGTTQSTLNDAFDGYNTLCVDVAGANGNCETGNSSYVIYNKNGPASSDAACPEEGIDFPVQSIVDNGSILDVDVKRQVYVPAGGDFARWLNTFTNNDSNPVTFRAAVSNNLGSDSNTISTGSSAGGAVSNGVTWFGSMQNYSGTTSSDVRLAHVLAGSGGSIGTSDLFYADGNDNPYWGYDITIQPGQTVTIANFVVGAATKANANATAASLAAGTHSGQWGCMTSGQKAEVLNFQLAAPPTTTTTTTATPTTEAPTSVAPAPSVEATGTLPYTGAGGELLPFAGAGAAAMAAGGAAVAATKRKLRRPRFRHARR